MTPHPNWSHPAWQEGDPGSAVRCDAKRAERNLVMMLSLGMLTTREFAELSQRNAGR
jgi:hypothetical protein